MIVKIMGMFDIYCALCGNPCNSNVQGAITEEHNWMNYCRVIISVPNKNEFTNIGEYGMFGNFQSFDDATISEIPDDFTFTENPISEKDKTFYMVHDSCWIVCNYPARFTSTAPDDLEQYQEQYFGGFPNDEDPNTEITEWMLTDPMFNDKNKNRIVSQLIVNEYFLVTKLKVAGTKNFNIMIDNKLIIHEINGNTTIAELKARTRNLIFKTYGKNIVNYEIFLNKTTKLNIDYHYDTYTFSTSWNQIDEGYIIPLIKID